MDHPPTPAQSQYRWHHELKQLFVLALERYRVGERSLEHHFSDAQKTYLASIGMSLQELYDFAEDHAKGDGDPDWETVLLITAARRDYFLTVLKGQTAGKTIRMDDLPEKDAKIDGIPWLARFIKKAEAKLRGEMPAELMYGCGGDRRFCQEFGIHPADFLRHIWAHQGDEAKMLQFVKSSKPANAFVEI